MSFSQLVSELGPPPPIKIEKQKKKKKRLSDFGPPLLQIPGHAPDAPLLYPHSKRAVITSLFLYEDNHFLYQVFQNPSLVIFSKTSS